MLYKEYGKTGKKVSAIGFGGMRFRKEDYEKNLEKAAEVVRHASKLGINYFDTAPFYCDDKSEEIFGCAFKNMPNDFYVSTKSNYNSEPTVDDLRRRVELSLERLGVEKINFHHMWCIMDLNHYKNVMKKGGPYEGALKLKDEGLIEHIVFSTHANGDEIEFMVNEGAFEGILLGYNATNFAYRQKGIKAAYEKGLGVVTMNPLGGGVIPQNPDYYGFLKENDQDSLVVSALKFNISHKEISVTLAGMGSIEEVEENVTSARDIIDMTDERLNMIQKHLDTKLDSLCTGCGYCKGCPVEIPIPKYMDAYNMVLLNKSEGLESRLKWHWGISHEKASECISCGVCEKKCTQHLPIINRLKEIVEISEKA